MKMTPVLLIFGGLLVFWSSTYINIFLAASTWEEEPSEQWRPLTSFEEQGHRLYVANGCSYCHSLYIRAIDWDIGAERIAHRGDYVGYLPAILGTERTGPDLSQAGGQHPDDWHIAHFINPRYTRPLSLMPSWEFLGDERIEALTAYVQSLGGKNADQRMERQRYWKKRALAAFQSGLDKNIEWLHAHVPEVWRKMPNPYPADAASLNRGKAIYQQFCINCHGPIGDGYVEGTRYMNPPPLNFTLLRRHLVEGKYIGGLLYYQIMNGITGTAMPYFKKELESEKIWDVSNYIAVTFIGYTDANLPPRGIDASYEPVWKNPYTAPTTRRAEP